MAGLKQGSTLKSEKYKIVKTLGQGSFGITYLATTRISMDGQLGKMDVNVNVTIKEFFMSDLNSRATDGTSVERTSSTLVKNYLSKFRREAENLSKLNHPNIVKVLEVFDENNTTYYVMEFIDGETIDEYIKRNGKLSVEESLKVTKEVCFALSYMHDHKMLHLDLKPKNIMHDSEGHIYLIDFGLAKQYNDNGEPESSTTLGLGTPGYAPIEQAHYKKDGTFPVTLDIYAVGASLYKMLTGKTPPESSYVLNEGLSLDALKQANVDAHVIAIVEKAMAPLKKDRYQTVVALSKAISTISLSNDEGTIIQDEEEGTIIDHDVTNDDKIVISKEKEEEPEEYEYEEPSFFEKYWMYGLATVVILLFIYFCSNWNSSSSTSLYDEVLDTLAVDSVAADSVVDEIVETSRSNVISFNAEAKPEPVISTIAVDGVDEMPSFPGGTSGFMAYLSQNVKYPALAEENGVQGKVEVSFVIETDGSITDVKITKSADSLLDAEAKRVIRSMPKWIPAKKNGYAVRVEYSTPITFRLE